MIKQSSYTITLAEMETTKKWYVVDATDMVVGRLASEVAKVRSQHLAHRHARARSLARD